jgi:hypothetical protein
MADLSAFAQTYTNAGVANATSYLPANNYKNVINQADVGRELIVKIVSNSTINDAELNAAVAYINTSHGNGVGTVAGNSGDSAFTVAAVGTADGSAFTASTTSTVFLRVQGTGDLTVASVKSAAEGAVGGSTGTFTVTIEAIFTPAK